MVFLRKAAHSPTLNYLDKCYSCCSETKPVSWPAYSPCMMEGKADGLQAEPRLLAPEQDRKPFTHKASIAVPVRWEKVTPLPGLLQGPSEKLTQWPVRSHSCGFLFPHFPKTQPSSWVESVLGIDSLSIAAPPWAALGSPWIARVVVFIGMDVLWP